ncbi:cache domain-containing sensor histidine kinase [Paenibacillus piri]|uniref:cache domain-containing sensor histidine kinase n=1 Tax=Paenibacillus piri TaxID=2547395 RepID=UPI001404B24D|nr:histidine kinase [Paenibacillus piri]
MVRKHPTIFSQLIVGFSVILLIIISLISYFTYLFSSQIVLNKTIQYLEESVTQMRGKIDVLLGEYDHLSQRISYNPETQNYLYQSNQIIGENKINTIGLQKVITHEEAYVSNDILIEIVDLYYRPAFYSSWSNEIKKMKWYSHVIQARGSMVWTSNDLYYKDSHTKTNMINGVLAVRQINDYFSSKSRGIGYMLIIIPMEVMQRTIGNFIDNSAKVQVLDQFGQIVYSTDVQEIGLRLDQGLLDKIGNKDEQFPQVEIDGELNYLTSSSSSYSNWTVVAYVKKTSVFNDLHKVQQSIVIIGLLGILAAFLLTAFFSWSLVKPIRKLARHLSGIEKGKISTYKAKMVNREVYILYDSFNNMIMNLNQTIRDLSDRKVRENQAQLIAMKAQFQPHFLYNCLNIIYYYAVMDKQNRVSDMVLTLSELLRYSVQPGSEFVTLQDDLDQLNRFIKLQRARYEDKLNIIIYVDEQLLKYPVMKLILQPVVENAVIHGLEPMKSERWDIHIHISRNGNNLNLIIEDSGIGMTSEQMAKALDFDMEIDHSKTLHTGLGLPNLQHRIQLIYGKMYGIALSHSHLGGLKVELNIPIVNEGEQE